MYEENASTNPHLNIESSVNTPVTSGVKATPNIKDIKTANLDDIVNEYNRVGSSFVDMGQALTKDIDTRQQLLVGNDYAKDSTGLYNYQRHYQAPTTSAANQVRQVGTNLALQEGQRRAQEAAQKRLESAQNRYNKYQQYQASLRAQQAAAAARQANNKSNSVKVNGVTVSAQFLKDKGLSVSDIQSWDSHKLMTAVKDYTLEATGMNDNKGSLWQDKSQWEASKQATGAHKTKEQFTAEAGGNKAVGLAKWREQEDKKTAHYINAKAQAMGYLDPENNVGDDLYAYAKNTANTVIKLAKEGQSEDNIQKALESNKFTVTATPYRNLVNSLNKIDTTLAEISNGGKSSNGFTAFTTGVNSIVNYIGNNPEKLMDAQKMIRGAIAEAEKSGKTEKEKGEIALNFLSSKAIEDGNLVGLRKGGHDEALKAKVDKTQNPFDNVKYRTWADLMLMYDFSRFNLGTVDEMRNAKHSEKITISGIDGILDRTTISVDDMVALGKLEKEDPNKFEETVNIVSRIYNDPLVMSDGTMKDADGNIIPKGEMVIYHVPGATNTKEYQTLKAELEKRIHLDENGQPIGATEEDLERINEAYQNYQKMAGMAIAYSQYADLDLDENITKSASIIENMLVGKSLDEMSEVERKNVDEAKNQVFGGRKFSDIIDGLNSLDSVERQHFLESLGIRAEAFSNQVNKVGKKDFEGGFYGVIDDSIDQAEANHLFQVLRLLYANAGSGTKSPNNSLQPLNGGGGDLKAVGRGFGFALNEGANGIFGLASAGSYMIMRNTTPIGLITSAVRASKEGVNNLGDAFVKAFGFDEGLDKLSGVVGHKEGHLSIDLTKGSRIKDQIQKELMLDPKLAFMRKQLEDEASSMAVGGFAEFMAEMAISAGLVGLAKKGGSKIAAKMATSVVDDGAKAATSLVDDGVKAATSLADDGANGLANASYDIVKGASSNIDELAGKATQEVAEEASESILEKVITKGDDTIEASNKLAKGEATIEKTGIMRPNGTEVSSVKNVSPMMSYMSKSLAEGQMRFAGIADDVISKLKPWERAITTAMINGARNGDDLSRAVAFAQKITTPGVSFSSTEALAHAVKFYPELNTVATTKWITREAGELAYTIYHDIVTNSGDLNGDKLNILKDRENNLTLGSVLTYAGNEALMDMAMLTAGKGIKGFTGKAMDSFTKYSQARLMDKATKLNNPGLASKVIKQTQTRIDNIEKTNINALTTYFKDGASPEFHKEFSDVINHIDDTMNNLSSEIYTAKDGSVKKNIFDKVVSEAPNANYINNISSNLLHTRATLELGKLRDTFPGLTRMSVDEYINANVEYQRKLASYKGKLPDGVTPASLRIETYKEYNLPHWELKRMDEIYSEAFASEAPKHKKWNNNADGSMSLGEFEQHSGYEYLGAILGGQKAGTPIQFLGTNTESGFLSRRIFDGDGSNPNIDELSMWEQIQSQYSSNRNGEAINVKLGDQEFTVNHNALNPVVGLHAYRNKILTETMQNKVDELYKQNGLILNIASEADLRYIQSGLSETQRFLLDNWKSPADISPEVLDKLKSGLEDRLKMYKNSKLDADAMESLNTIADMVLTRMYYGIPTSSDVGMLKRLLGDSEAEKFLRKNNLYQSGEKKLRSQYVDSFVAKNQELIDSGEATKGQLRKFAFDTWNLSSAGEATWATDLFGGKTVDIEKLNELLGTEANKAIAKLEQADKVIANKGAFINSYKIGKSYFDTYRVGPSSMSPSAYNKLAKSIYYDSTYRYFASQTLSKTPELFDYVSSTNVDSSVLSTIAEQGRVGKVSEVIKVSDYVGTIADLAEKSGVKLTPQQLADMADRIGDIDIGFIKRPRKSGQYDSVNKRISIEIGEVKNPRNLESTFFHELTHAAYDAWREVDPDSVKPPRFLYVSGEGKFRSASYVKYHDFSEESITFPAGQLYDIVHYGGKGSDLNIDAIDIKAGKYEDFKSLTSDVESIVNTVGDKSGTGIQYDGGSGFYYLDANTFASLSRANEYIPLELLRDATFKFDVDGVYLSPESMKFLADKVDTKRVHTKDTVVHRSVLESMARLDADKIPEVRKPSGLSQFGKFANNLQLAAGFGIYNMLSLRYWLNAIQSDNIAGAKNLFTTHFHARSQESVKKYFSDTRRMHLLTEAEKYIGNDLSNAISEVYLGSNGTGINGMMNKIADQMNEARFVKGKAVKGNEIAKDMLSALIEDPTSQRFFPVLKMKMLENTYKAELARLSKGLKPDEISQAITDEAIKRASFATERFFDPKFKMPGYDEFFDAKLNRSALTDFDARVKAANPGKIKSIGNFISDFVFALTHGRIMTNHWVDGVKGTINPLNWKDSRYTRGRRFLYSFLGTAALAQLWNETTTGENEFEKIALGLSNPDVYHPLEVLGSFGKLGQFKLDNDYKLDPYFSVFTMPNYASKLAMSGANAFIEDPVKRFKNVKGFDQELASGLVSPLRTMYDLIGGTYNGVSIWGKGASGRDKDGKLVEYSPLDNAIAIVSHVTGLDQFGIGANLTHKNKADGLRAGTNAKGQSIKGSGLLQHAYIDAFLELDKGNLFDAMVKTFEIPIKKSSATGVAKAELNGWVVDAIKQYKQEYDDKLNSAITPEEKDKLFDDFTKKTLKIFSIWNERHNILNKEPESYAIVQKMMLGLLSNHYDEETQKMRNSYWASGVSALGGFEQKPGESEEAFKKRLETVQSVWNIQFEKDFNVREKLRSEGYSVGGFDMVDAKHKQTQKRNQITAQFKKVLESPIGQYPNMKSAKEGYMEQINLAKSMNNWAQAEKLELEYKDLFFSRVAPYIQQYSEAILLNNKEFLDSAKELVIIPTADSKKYLSDNRNANWLKDQFGVGFKNGTQYISDDNYVVAYNRVIKDMLKGNMNLAKSRGDRLMQDVVAGKYTVPKKQVDSLIMVLQKLRQYK